jgi:tetratricopeptide (TPR) repeat protein
LSLARKRDNRLLKEVQFINGPEHNFLLGFYYRLQGRAKDAIDQLNECLKIPFLASRAKRELVQVFLSLEEYTSAHALAESNYRENKSNPFHIQAYFNTLVNSKEATESHEILKKLIKELKEL